MGLSCKAMRLMILLLVSTLLVTAAERKPVAPESAKTVGPYSPGMWAGDTLYVSGQGARDAEGKLPDGIEAQTRQTMNNIKAIVEAAGLSMADVVFTHAYLDNMANEPGMRGAYSSFFEGQTPATITIGVAKMPTGTPVEISAVAVRDRKAPRLYIGAQPDGAGLGRALRNAKLDESNLLMVTIYHVKDGYDAAQKEQASLTKLTEPPPVQLIQVASLPGNGRVSITAVAALDKGDRKVFRASGVSVCAATGDTVYCSSRTGRGGDMAAQVRATVAALDAGLKGLGADLSRAVSNNVYLNRIEDFAGMNSVYAESFPAPPPTRTTVQPQDTVNGAPLVRIGVIAVR